MFKTLIYANHVFKKEDVYDSFHLTEEDEHAIRQLAQDPRVGEKVVVIIIRSN